MPAVSKDIEHGGLASFIRQPRRECFDSITVAEHEHPFLRYFLQRETSGSEPHFAHMAQLQPVFRYFFELFINERVSLPRALVPMNDPKCSDRRGERQCLQIHNRLFSHTYGLKL